MDSPFWVYLIGFAGMGIYGVRILIQWYLSEKSHSVESPGIYWILSSIGAVILYVYGWLRKDFVIVIQALFPVLILALIARDYRSFVDTFLQNEDVPLGLLLFGVLGQFTYEMRTVYQLVYSYKRHRSILPLGHWVLGVVGSVMIIAYGIVRHDWVLAIGQFSIVFTVRNLMISIAEFRQEGQKDDALEKD